MVSKVKTTLTRNIIYSISRHTYTFSISNMLSVTQLMVARARRDWAWQNLRFSVLQMSSRARTPPSYTEIDISSIVYLYYSITNSTIQNDV